MVIDRHEILGFLRGKGAIDDRFFKTNDGAAEASGIAEIRFTFA